MELTHDNTSVSIPSSMSEEADNLLGCFDNGVEAVVRQLAEDIAKRDNSYLDDGATVAIERKHVHEAGCRIVAALRKLFDSQTLPPEAMEMFQGMLSCFESNNDT